MTGQDTIPFRILFVGPEYNGSDSGGLARAFRQLGHLVKVVDETQYSFRLSGQLIHRVIGRAFRPVAVREMGREILRQSRLFKPHFVLVFKGSLVPPWALRELRQNGVYLINFYPDVSVMCHGALIPQCLPLYDHIFTTKTFGIADMQALLKVRSAEFLPHGFEPGLHRPMRISREALAWIGADVSFIGTWSPKKTAYMETVAKMLPNMHIRIWGGQWEKAGSTVLQPLIMGHEIWGDLYPLAIQCTKINIAILSEIRKGASSGDLITARTFQIPACGGFMLHERTNELLEYYKEDDEVACFTTPEELADKTQYYLSHEEERERIRLAGYKRCIADNSLVSRAEVIVRHYMMHSPNMDDE